MEIESSDALKIYDALTQAWEHHHHRDISNARIHAAAAVRFSPLTVTLDAQRGRLATLMSEQGINFGPDVE